MKFLHTSDLHLGLRLCETRLNEELVHILGEITAIAVQENCDAVLIAGDIYDRSNPTPESVRIFDEFVTALSEKKIAVLSIYGNHDAPERVAYLSGPLKSSGVHFSPMYDGTLTEVTFDDRYGTVHIYLLPFLRPSVVRLTCPDFDGSSTADAVRFALGGIDFSEPERRVVLAHQFIAGTEEETDTVVGNTDLIPYTLFEAFDYAALGHLHAPHPVGKDYIRYAGSPMKCSFSEAADEKSVTIVELFEKGKSDIRTIPLTPLHDLREMRGSYMEMTSPEMRAAGNTEDYLRIILTDDEDIPDVMAKLRTIYPNLLRLSYDNKRTQTMHDINSDLLADTKEDALTPEAVFAELYELQYNEPASPALMAEVSRLFEETEKEGQHATA